MGRRRRRVGEGCIEGWACPKCGQFESFIVQGVSMFEIEALGTDQCGGVEWSDESLVRCPDCGWKGTVKDVEVPEDEWL